MHTRRAGQRSVRPLNCGVRRHYRAEPTFFVCSENRLRSPSAEAVFSSYENIEAIGAGTNANAPTEVSGDLIEWSDIICVMEKSHRSKIGKKHRHLLKGKRVIGLGIS